MTGCDTTTEHCIKILDRSWKAAVVDAQRSGVCGRVTARELDANTFECGIRITSLSSSYASDAAIVIGGAGWLAESGNRGPGVCGRGGVSARSSEKLSAAGTAELSAAGGCRDSELRGTRTCVLELCQSRAFR